MTETSAHTHTPFDLAAASVEISSSGIGGTGAQPHRDAGTAAPEALARVRQGDSPSGSNALSALNVAARRLAPDQGFERAEGPHGVRSVITDPFLRQQPAAGSAAKSANAQESSAEQGLDGHARPNTKEESQLEQASQTEDSPPSDGGGAAKGGAESDAPTLADAPKRSAPGRKSRAKKTTDRMEAFAARFFFDYLSVTVANEINGTGEKPGLTEAPTNQEGFNKLARGPVLRPEWAAAEVHEGKALNSLLRFVVTSGLYKRAEGEGRQGYKLGFQFGAHPTQGKPYVTVRGGHARNMPSMEISGGNGECARIAPLVRKHLGPQLVSRADVSIDIDQPGLFEKLHDYMIARSPDLKVHPPEVEGDKEGGRTLYWLRYLGLKRNGRKRYRKRGVWLRVYQKDKERLAREMIAPEDVRPHLVRIEFVFIQDERKGKTRLALMTPQEMIADHQRSREMVEWLAIECEGLAKEEAVMGLTKVSAPACDKTAEERAITGIGQYKATFIDAAIERIVDRDFGSDWSAAEVAPRDVRKEVARLVLRELAFTGAVENRVLWHGLDQIRTDAGKAERLRDQMNSFLSRQKVAHEAASKQMAAAYAVASDGDHRQLNELRSEIVWDHAVLSARRGEMPPTLAALDRAMERTLRGLI
ncbi:hypothetical protein [Mangrovicoccus algicola]|uniref:Uncharacterized protein n=1 Tax=Mangrovicoccus algicola TaxID=2771008 RepID=A0A8J6YT89_9RHOB|nr:hypothetical protein [Mangrovicoccus algicola]MBE3637210.1 hypothetical protein [Mangrovicoccus algicola]